VSSASIFQTGRTAIDVKVCFN